MKEQIKEDTTGFFRDWLALAISPMRGWLQYKANADSIRNLYFLECYTCAETFQIVLVHKDSSIRKDENKPLLSEAFSQGRANWFSDFNSFAFVYTMRDPDKQIDIHESNVDFPLIMKIYKRISNDE